MKAARQLCIQDNMDIEDFMEECVKLGLEKHNWKDGGNPQNRLTRYMGSAKVLKVCGRLEKGTCPEMPKMCVQWRRHGFKCDLGYGDEFPV